MRLTPRHAAAAALVGGLVLASAAPAFADTVSTSGTTAGGPTYNRRLAGTPCGAASSVGTAVRYTTVPLSVATAGSYTVTSTTSVTYDGFLFLYAAPFDPTAPATRCLGGSDDFTNATASQLSLPLTAGTAYTIVQTGFANTDSGPFALTVSGPGAVSLADAVTPPPTLPEVPVPALLALAGLGLLGGVTAVRHRRPAA